MSLNDSHASAAATGAQQVAKTGGVTSKSIATATSPNTNAATPLNHNSSNASLTACNFVTGEKRTAADKSMRSMSDDVAHEVLFSVTGPDGSVVHLSSNTDVRGAPSHIILGRGKVGIPSSAVHVSRKACVLRLVNQGRRGSVTSDVFTLELVVLGSNPCRVTRTSSSESIFVKSMSQILEDSNDTSPLSIILNDGDTVEPYERPEDCTIDQAEKNGAYYPFRVSINNAMIAARRGEEGDIDGSAFVEASKKIDNAAQCEKPKAAATVGVQTDLPGDSMGQTETVRGEKEGKPCDERLPLNETILANPCSKQSVANEHTEGRIPSSDGNNNSNPFDAVDVEAKGTLPIPAKVSESQSSNSWRANIDDLCTQEEVESMSLSDEEELETQLEIADPGVLAGGGTNLSLAKGKEGASNESTMNDSSDELMLGIKDFTQVSTIKKSTVDYTSSSDESSVGEIAEGRAYDDIEEILASVNSPGSFAVGGSCNGKLLMPGLVVNGIGTIGLPLSENQAKELAKHCSQSQVGHGSESIIDNSDRNTFEIAAKHIRFTNPTWTQELNDLTKQVCQGLGVQAHSQVEAKLSKLILYEEGSFFASQRKRDMADGVFGTLVVALPTQFTGGEIVVKYRDETETFEQAGQSGFSSQYLAFYAERKHELKRVTSGHRLCLVYNLVKRHGTRPRAINKESLVKRLAAAGKKWEDEYKDTKIILGGTNNSIATGRNNGSIIELLELAIKQGAPLDFDRGTLCLNETGTGNGDVRYLRRNCYDRYHDTNFTWDETDDREFTLHLSNYGDTDLSYSETDMLEDHFDGEEPTCMNFEPHDYDDDCITATREYEDERAIVIWPRSRRWALTTNNDTSKMCKYLLRACEEGTLDSESKEECNKKLETVMTRVLQEKSNCTTNVEEIMRCIVQCGNEKLGKKFLIEYTPAKGKPDGVIKQIQAFIECFGGDVISPIILSWMNATRFTDDPTGTAKFLIQLCKSLGKPPSNAKLIEGLIEAFVDAMCPPQRNAQVSKKNLDSFPLDALLDLFVCGKHSNSSSAKLASRILEGYLFMSCQKTHIKPQHSWHSSIRTYETEGPTLLLSSAMSLLSMCEKYGWIKYEDVLVKAAEKLCQYGNASCIVELVEKFTTIASVSSKHATDRSRICSRMATIACGKILARAQPLSPHQYFSTLSTYKNLARVIGTYCPSMAPRFVESAKTLDIDSILYPLVTDKTLRSSATVSIMDSVRSLTLYCATKLKSRVSTNLGSINVWSLPNASLSRNSEYASFLRDPCKQTRDWQVRKSDHKAFLQDLRPLLHLGEVSAESYQPRGKGAWCFKIVKLKRNAAPVATLSRLQCACPANTTSSYRQHNRFAASTTSCCLLRKCKLTLSKHREDQKKVLVVKSLLTPDQRRQLEGTNEDGGESRKRKVPASSMPSSSVLPPAPVNGGAIQRQKTTANSSAILPGYLAERQRKHQTQQPAKTSRFMPPAPRAPPATNNIIPPANTANRSVPPSNPHSQQAAKKQRASPTLEVIDLT